MTVSMSNNVDNQCVMRSEISNNKTYTLTKQTMDMCQSNNN